MRRLRLEKLTALCPKGHAVLLALLCEAARTGRARIRTDREKIGKAIGVKRLATISKALCALERLEFVKIIRRSKLNSDGSFSGGYLEIVIGNGTLSALSVSLNLLRDGAKNATPERGTPIGNVAESATPSLKRVETVPSATAPVPFSENTFNPIQRAIQEKAELTHGII